MHDCSSVVSLLALNYQRERGVEHLFVKVSFDRSLTERDMRGGLERVSFVRVNAN